MSTYLCDLGDIKNNGSSAFILQIGAERLAILAVRRDGTVYAYLNSCPHIGSPLDFTPGQFLDLERRHILCSTHGALFRIEDGHCISGPCAGKALTPLTTRLENGEVHVSEPLVP